jgi:endogenous inhibitor of DNA gyrase (YacG/DUF329 family)
MTAGANRGVLRVEHECPQCGGAVSLGEADRLLACPFCRARLTLWPGEFFRYWIPPAPEAGDEVLLAPYWRIRGLDCALRPYTVRERVLDATFPAVPASCLPRTLGLRPQALKLRFATAKTPAFFLAPASGLAEALAGTAELSRLADEAIEGAAALHREFVVATASLVYTPLLVRDAKVLDALLMRELPGCAGEAEGLLARVERERRWGLSFFAAICPECGRDLDGGPRSVVLFCRSCRAAWQGAEGGLQRVGCDAPPAAPGSVLLPFWRLRADIDAFGLRTGEDLTRFANVSPGVRKGAAGDPLWFWVPAFPLSPGPFLRVARQLTIAQLPLAAEVPEGTEWGEVQSATIEAGWAFGAVKVLLAQLGQPRKEVFPAVPAVRATLAEARLALLPFAPSAGDWIQAETAVSITRSTLRGV